MITFEYNGKIYKPSNLENKLKKLGITINDVKIIDDTKSNAEKEREERSQQISNSEETVDVYWDNNAKGWYIVDNLFPYSLEWSKQFLKDINIKHKRYISVGYNINKNNLSEFFKENYKKVILNNF